MKKILTSFTIIGLIIMTGCASPTDSTSNADNDSTEPIEEKVATESLLSPDRILNIAHRGASGHAPEHTLAAYDMVQALDGDYLEIDLQMTKDGELIAMHDSDVSRTTDGEGEVNELSLEDITGLDAGEWFNDENPELAEPAYSNAHVPTLRDIFDTFGTDVNYYIETKQPEESPEMVSELISLLNEYDMLGDDTEEGQVIVQSFSEKSLLEVQELDPTLPLIQLISYKKKANITDEELDKINEYAVGIGANYKYLSKNYVKKVREHHLLLHPYTVNDKKDMKQMIEWGVTGMFTNYPDRLNEVLEEMKEE